MFAIALDVRTPHGRRPFVMRVALEPPVEVVPQRPPRALPLLRGSWPRQLVVWAAITAGFAWWYSWWALIIPVYLGLVLYENVRQRGALPHRLHAARHLVDVLVVAAAFLVLWATPAVVSPCRRWSRCWPTSRCTPWRARAHRPR